MSAPRHRPPSICTTETVRRTVRTVRRGESAPSGEPVYLSRQARNLVRRHAIESRTELPDWALRDLFAMIDTAEQLETQLSRVRYKLQQCTEALRVGLQAVADAEASLDQAEPPVQA